VFCSNCGLKSSSGNFCTDCGASLSANSDVRNDAPDSSASDELEAAANEAAIVRQKQHAEFVARVTQDKDADGATDGVTLQALAKAAGEDALVAQARETQRQRDEKASRLANKNKRRIGRSAAVVAIIVIALTSGGIALAASNQQAALQQQLADVQAASKKAAADAQAASKKAAADAQAASKKAAADAQAAKALELPRASTIPGALVAAFGAYCPNQTEPWPENRVKITPGVTPQNTGYWEILSLAVNGMLLGFHVTPNAAGTVVTVQASNRNGQLALTYWQCAANMRVAMY